LLPALCRAGQVDDALALVDISFVSNSVSHGHPFEAIERNLALALDVAARNLRWPDLVRCIELSRSAYTCFEEKLHDPIPYWETYLDLFGPEAFVERLLFDGKITQDPGLGLILCSLADDSAVTPPWREYLNEYEILPHEDEDDQTVSTGDEIREERVSLARIHGLIRLRGFEALFESILNHLIEHGEHARPSYIIALATRIAHSAGPKAINSIIDQGTDPAFVSSPLVPRVVALLKLGLAEALKKAGDKADAAEAASAAIDNVDSPELAVNCLRYGADLDKAVTRALPPTSLDIGLDGHIYDDKAKEIRKWVASIRLLAHTDPALLDDERIRIEGEGWYRCWLRFVIALAEVEAAKRAGQTSPGILSAFKELIGDVRPFVGNPRASDLYSIRELIHETLEWGLSLLDAEAEWAEALDDLRTVLDGTSVTLQRGPMGPLFIETVLEILLPYSQRPNIGTLVRSFSESLVADKNARGTYFEHHAERGMILARIIKDSSDNITAYSVWGQVGIYLCGYGFRKDTTIYEILDSIPALMGVGRNEALAALAAAQSLASAMLRHTDGSGTNRAPLSWFRSLLKCDTPTGLLLLAHSMGVRDATTDWPLEEALHDALEETSDSGDAILLDALYSSMPFEVEYEGISEKFADERLAVVSRLLERKVEWCHEALQRLAAQVSGDGQRYTAGAIKRVQTFASKHKIPVPQLCDATDKADTSQPVTENPFGNLPPDHRRIIADINMTYFPADANSVDLVASVRRAAESSQWNNQMRDNFVNVFGYWSVLSTMGARKKLFGSSASLRGCIEARGMPLFIPLPT